MGSQQPIQAALDWPESLSQWAVRCTVYSTCSSVLPNLLIMHYVYSVSVYIAYRSFFLVPFAFLNIDTMPSAHTVRLLCWCGNQRRGNKRKRDRRYFGQVPIFSCGVESIWCNTIQSLMQVCSCSWCFYCCWFPVRSPPAFRKEVINLVVGRCSLRNDAVIFVWKLANPMKSLLIIVCHLITRLFIVNKWYKKTFRHLASHRFNSDKINAKGL